MFRTGRTSGRPAFRLPENLSLNAVRAAAHGGPYGCIIHTAPEIRRAAKRGGPYKVVRWFYRNSFGGPAGCPTRTDKLFVGR